MDLFPGEISQELLEGIMAVGGSHMMSSPSSRNILDRSHEEETTSPQHHTVEPEPVAQDNLTNTPTQNFVIDEDGRSPRVNPGRISITRNEIVALSTVLDRLPPTLLQGKRTEWDQPISLMVTNESGGDQVNTMNVLDPIAAVDSEMPMVPYPPIAGSSLVRGKRQRPKYSLKTHMFRKKLCFKVFGDWTPR